MNGMSRGPGSLVSSLLAFDTLRDSKIEYAAHVVSSIAAAM